jgi:hypothetical protein
MKEGFKNTKRFFYKNPSGLITNIMAWLVCSIFLIAFYWRFVTRGVKKRDVLAFKKKKRFCYGVFVRFLTRGVQKHHTNFGESPCQKLLAEKVERKKHFFPVVFSLRFRFIAFLAVSLHEQPKTAIKMFSKPDQKISTKSQQKEGR